MGYLKGSEIDFKISEIISDYVKDFLVKNKMTRTTLCDELNVTYVNMNKILNNHQYVPLSFILKFKDKFNIDLLDLINKDSVNIHNRLN